MLNNTIARRTLKTTVKAFLIALSVGAGLTVLLLTILTAAFSMSSDKALELSQSIPVDADVDVDATEETVETLALIDTGENFVLTPPPESAMVSILDEPEIEAPSPATVLVIPNNASKSWLQGMCIHRCIEYPKQATRAQLIDLLKAHHQASA